MCPKLHVSGKRPGRPLVAMAVGQNKTRLLYAWDRNSGRRFLVDTGAEVSVFPASMADRRSGRQGLQLTAANGSNICTYGKRTIPLRFNKHCFQWTFTIAQVSQPLLGADFLRAHALLVDIKGQRLINASDYTCTVSRQPYHTSAPSLQQTTSTAGYWPIFQRSQHPPSLTRPPSTGWNTLSPPPVHPSMPTHEGSHLTSCKLPRTNSGRWRS